MMRKRSLQSTCLSHTARHPFWGNWLNMSTTTLMVKNTLQFKALNAVYPSLPTMASPNFQLVLSVPSTIHCRFLLVNYQPWAIFLPLHDRARNSLSHGGQLTGGFFVTHPDKNRRELIKTSKFNWHSHRPSLDQWQNIQKKMSPILYRAPARHASAQLRQSHNQ